MQAFKRPLSNSDEAYYLALCKAGDLSARNTLVEYNLRLVAHIVKKYSTGNRDIDDLISIGTIGLIKAINTFDADKGNRLVTYASRCIENEILMRLRQERKEAREVSLSEPIGTDKEGNEISLIDVICGEDDNTIHRIISNEQISKLKSCFSHVLTEREKQIIIMRYGICDTRQYAQREIASALGISRSYVSRIEKKALLKLRSALNE